MRIVPKSCAAKIILILLVLTIIYFSLGSIIFKSIYDLLDSDDKVNGKYDAVILECWLKPQSTMIKIADSLYKGSVIKDIYITHFKSNLNKFYSGGEVPKYINEIINLYVLEFTSDTALFKKISIIPKDPITLNLAFQTAEFIKSKNYKRILVISESYHSQRTRLSFRKAFENTGIEVTTIPSELGITRNNWWKTDSGLSTIFSETVKLIYYWLFIL